MAYDVVKKVQNVQKSIWLAESHGVRKMIAWLFRCKIQETMKGSVKYPLEQFVRVDEFERPKKESKLGVTQGHRLALFLQLKKEEINMEELTKDVGNYSL